jgi:hypothetical protein
MIRNSRSASVSRPLLAIVLAMLLPVPAVLAQNPTTPTTSKAAGGKQPAVKLAAAAPVATAPKTAAKAAPAKTTPAKTAAKTAPAAAAAPSGKPVLVATYGDWGAYSAQTGKSKTCYALAQPKDRAPASLKRDPAYIFISTRPAEGVRNEISFVMGFTIKPADGSTDPQVKVGSSTIAMVAEGTNLWVKNAAEEGQLLDAMKKNQKLTVRAASAKGNVTTDTYSLSGLGQAIDRVQKECS